MKKIQALGVGMAIVLVTSLSALAKTPAYTALSSEYEGSMMPFDFSRVEPVEWPDSLKPCFCAYVARHGSRYMSSERKFLKLEKALQQAELDGYITKKGKAFLSLLKEVREITGNRWGELSPLGVEEERQLGQLMFRDFAPLHEKSAILTVSSFVPRAEMTMYQFNHSLLLNNDSIATITATGHQFSPLVYCFAYDKVYSQYRKDGNWKEYIDRYEEEKVPTEALTRLIGKELTDTKKARELTLQIYSVLQSLRAMGLPAPTDEFMTTDEFRKCWQVSNFTHYLRNNVSALDNSCVMATKPLIEAILNNCDNALNDSTRHLHTQLHGYFGHAETLLPLLSVMQIPGCYAMPDDPDDLEKSWQIQDITPLAANFALYILLGPSDTPFVAARLNGRNVEPIKGRGMIVPWEEAREHWQYLLTALQPRRR